MSAYARINHAEFESEDALAHFEKEYNAHFREWFPDMKIAIGVRTGSKSLLMLSVYPSEDAAEASLEARQKSLGLFSGTLRDEFYSAGTVSVWGIVNPN
tara:strand:+ start:16 stop:312 length:297 start_codon:yes stop_codon:yes gene_type:complete